jgi:tetratricopeptide (TPR) repeat protein
MDSALAWMEGLISKQDSAEEFSPSNLEEDIETLPESLSREPSLNDDSGDETVSTPSWLKELEIETGEVPDQDSDQVLEGLSSLVSDSSIETKTTEFSSEMNLDKTNDQDLEDFLDRLETEIDGKKGDFFDQEIEKERVQSGDLTSEETEQPLSQQMEIEQQEEQEEEPGKIESLELTVETSFEEISTVELGDELATTSLEEEVVTEEIFDDEVQGLEILEEIPSPDDELDEHTEEILETTERERDFVSALEEEIEDTQPLKVRDDRLPDLEKANRYLESGNLEESIAIFNEFIDGSFELDQIIHNIQNALDHHFPIDINLWQALGDAYLKNNQLQNALDAYSKAEDLLS